ncbi:murein biosynthesis integral membrane protein MurJ [Streptomyces sp. H10-C2]|uniref:murein biosynthesis integral membrane protein MurJ n=1 Tax=unclassified Streptomyces TaxID=2593676 RepID=UPI0024BBB9A5|nr:MULTISPECIES: murein biosynthesis integral membrane protein MurJ [unclassified Streptomyces]MDJ0341491.1 murein biosynthesis integral membrane protein MurJ [Streptomyces sp. PH10-H1]MDJ0369148.1 murein biosynthesis integral membrane protein MurJ [Streptomyces sp. H10-C2]
MTSAVGKGAGTGDPGGPDSMRAAPFGGPCPPESVAPAVAPVPAGTAGSAVPGPRGGAPADTAGSLKRSGSVMALGSLASRATGFVRSGIITAALGTTLLGDAFSVANTVPNILYIMLIGGALNSVFVPQLVRAAKEHSDGGAAYTDRLLTVCLAALLVITAAAALAAPWLVSAYGPDFTSAQRDLTIALARYCLPQILFYGVFTLLGQILTARDRFGAMMWSPVLNNVVVIAVFGLYLAVAHDTTAAGSMSDGDALLIGLGSTAGIAVQALALIPALRGAGFRWRPRFDWRGSGLMQPLRAAGWTLLLVFVNQIAYWVVTRLATSAGVHAVAEGSAAGAGYAAYSNAYLLWVVPQGIITVSLVTALLPRMSRAAAEGDHARIGADLTYGLRGSAAAIVPAVLAFLALGPQLTGVVFQHGRTSDADAQAIAWILMAFALGLPAFAGQYLLARGFYALGDTRTPFFLNVVIAAVNAGLAVTSYALLPARWAVAGMAGGYAIACCAGLTCTTWVLRRRLTWRPMVLGTHLRLAAAGLPGALAAYGIAYGCGRLFGTGLAGDLSGLLLGGAALGASVLALSGPLRLTEVRALAAPLLRRLPGHQPARDGA